MQKWLLLTKYRAIAVTVWAILVAILVSTSPQFLDNLNGVSLSVDDSSSQQTQELLSKQFPTLPSEQNLVVLHSETLKTSDPAYRSYTEQAMESLQGKPHVVSLTSPYESDRQISATGHTSFILVGLEGTDTELQKSARELESTLPASTSEMRAYLTGPSPLGADVVEQENHDIGMAELIGLPAAFLVLLFAFRSVVAAGLPLLLGGIGIMITFGLLGVIGHFMSFDVFVESAVTMIGLALGIDYCLMIITRFREELKIGDTPIKATQRTMKTAGRAVLFSGITVMVSLSGLLLVQSSLFRGIAVGTMTTVGVMLALCLTLLPIILSLLGPRINWLRILRPQKSREIEHGFWNKWSRAIMRRPIIVALGTTVILLALAWPALGLQLGLNLGNNTLDNQNSAIGLRLVEKEFGPGIISPIHIIVSRTSGSLTDADLASIASIDEKLIEDTNVKAVDSVTRRLDQATGGHTSLALQSISQQQPSLLQDQLNIQHGSNVAITTIILDTTADSEQAVQFLSSLRGRIALLVASNSDLHVGYTGSTAQIIDLTKEVERSMPVVLAFVLGLSFVLLAISFRSLVLPLKAIIMNLLALSATFGLTTVVFQLGFGEQLLDFTSPGYIQNYLPLLTFVILFGLSMDYEVFLLSRIQEEWRKTHDNTTAIAHGIEHTAKVITYAAAIMIVVFTSFIIAHMLEIKQLGFALAVAVLIDATLIRLMLVPTTMRLMGKWNWWMPVWRRKRNK